MITNILIIDANRIPSGSGMHRLMANLDIFIIIDDDVFYYKKCRYGDTYNKNYSVEVTLDKHMEVWNEYKGTTTDRYKVQEIIEVTHIRGKFLGIYDRNGRPVMDGDTLNFDKNEWGDSDAPVETFKLRDMIGQWPYAGTRDDVSVWREITNR